MVSYPKGFEGWAEWGELEGWFKVILVFMPDFYYNVSPSLLDPLNEMPKEREVGKVLKCAEDERDEM
jgi:hypothetical protein